MSSLTASVVEPAAQGSSVGLTSAGGHLLEQRETFADEGGQILRLTRGHEVAVDDDLLVDDVRTDELEFALDRPPGLQPVVLVSAGGEEELRPVADREDRLLPLEERLDERDRRVVRAKAIRREAARDEQRVELVWPHVRERALDDRGLAALVAVQLLAGFEADDRHLVAGLPERVVGLAEFGVLEAVGKHTRDLHGCSPLAPSGGGGQADGGSGSPAPMRGSRCPLMRRFTQASGS